ncbi:hypothetical protein [Cellulomonas dongxiuzhuiae]|uniref:hypothetical protein n=1 Tax=Cellulomonas dongxiuzhuiae TaxID=2819979 RepID=UPI001AAE2D03|nr:hypothetical protein [Cellulomonas dongxiuzhuiae]MBO3087113.1 hypothetical protein [Cellulomonas dongxiuzhuiae]
MIATEHPHPVEAAALALAQTLQVGPDDLPPHPQVVAPPRRDWDQAGRYLRAASDLLATHVNVTGRALTPDAALVWDPVARNAALGRVGGFVAQLSVSQDALALRAGQAGLRWERVGRWLPPGDRTRTVALEVVRVAELSGATVTDLDGLTAASTQVHSTRPADRLGELIARIRRTAWDVREQPDCSVRTLADVARAGFEVAVHTATFHGVDLHDRQAVGRDPSARRAGAWLALMGDLRGYLGAGPGNGQIHADVAAVHQLLGDLVPRDRLTSDRGSSANPDERHLGGTLHGACAALVQASEWNAATFARLARTAQVYVPIDTLSRDELSDQPDLATAKLNGARLVPALAERTETTLDRYRDVARAGISTATSRWDPAVVAHARTREDATLVLSREPAALR